MLLLSEISTSATLSFALSFPVLSSLIFFVRTVSVTLAMRLVSLRSSLSLAASLSLSFNWPLSKMFSSLHALMVSLKRLYRAPALGASKSVSFLVL